MSLSRIIYHSQSNICLKKNFVQRVSPAKKIPAQAEGEKKNSCKLKIPLPPPPPITFLMVRPLANQFPLHYTMIRDYKHSAPSRCSAMIVHTVTKRWLKSTNNTVVRHSLSLPFEPSPAFLFLFISCK